jgi:hypothetical protein
VSVTADDQWEPAGDGTQHTWSMDVVATGTRSLASSSATLFNATGTNGDRGSEPPRRSGHGLTRVALRHLRPDRGVHPAILMGAATNRWPMQWPVRELFELEPEDIHMSKAL